MKIKLPRRFGNLKIGTRLALSYLVIFVLLMATIGYASYTMSALQQQSAATIEEVNFKREMGRNISSAFNTIFISTRTILIRQDDAAAVADASKAITDSRKAYGDALTQLAAFANSDAETEILLKIEEATKRGAPLNREMVELALQGRRDEASALLADKLRPFETAALEATAEYTAFQAAKAVEVSASNTQRLKLTLIQIGAASLGALLISLVLAYFNTRSITKPIGALQKAIGHVREGGDMRALVMPGTKDEMADMGFAVNQMLQEHISAREKSESERKKAEEDNEGLNNSVIALLQAVNQLSQRDLTARAPLSGDIIDTVADSINQLTDETSKVLYGVTQIANRVAETSGQVRVQGNMVAATSQEERKNVEEMIKSLVISAQAMSEIAELASKSNNSAERATKATNVALDTVNSTVLGMDSIRETIAETEKRIKRLGERSQEISSIVSLINTISERTHVLALNASMQAAVAGEAGRGFAVVAEEVQRLAESSRNATQQIGTLVSNIQLETNETISTVNRTIGQVVQGSQQAQQAGESMRLTQEITSELVGQVQTIAQAYAMQKSMSDSLLESVKRLGESNARTAQQVDAQSQETEALIASARQLVESVTVFRLPQIA